ncbi:MAG: ferritin-like domain-containing protein [Frankia sp.]
MSTHRLYTAPVPHDTFDVEAAGSARFTWEYDNGRDRLLALYQKGKDKQWDASSRIDWDLEVDPYNALGLPDASIAIYGTKYWDAMSQAERANLRRHFASWQFSQFLHGEQGALICAARIVESVPDLDAKFYAATQTMDEARHVELFARFLQDKIGMVYPINDELQRLLDDTLRDSRWDLPYLGMQVLIEGLALAAFGLVRDVCTTPLPKQLLAYVMQDEARHVAFGRIALRDYYRELTEAERHEREEFVIEGCYLMADRIRGREVWENAGIDADAAMELGDQSEYTRLFRTMLFSRIVPCVKDIGLWGKDLQRAYVDLGVLDMGDANLDVLMARDEDIAEGLDADRFAAEQAARRAEVDAVVAGADD